MSVPVRSVSHAFAILRLLSGNSPLTLSDISRKLDLSPSSALNVLHTLIHEGAVTRGARDKTYRLAPDWTDLAALRNRDADRLGEIALPLMARIAETENAALGLWQVITRDRMQLVVHAESKAEMRLQLADAQRQPLGAGAAGRAIAAVQHLNEAELRRRFSAVRWQRGLSFEDYAGQIEEALAKGYAIDRGFAHRDVLSIAVAVARPAPGYCLSASLLSTSMNDGDIERLAGRMTEIWASVTTGRQDGRPRQGGKA